MMHPSIEKLLRIQGIDNQVRFLTNAMEVRPRELDDDRKKLAHAKSRVTEVENAIKRRKMDVKQGELEVKRCEEEIVKTKVSLNQAKSNDEFAVLKAQIERIGDEQGAFEERVLEHLTDIDQLEETQKALAAEYTAEEKIFQRKEGEVGEIVSSLQQKLEGTAGDRAGIVDTVPPDHMEIYTRVSDRYNGPAVSLVRDKVCSGCSMSVNNQEVSLLMGGQELVRCRSCARLLYIED